MKCLVYKEGYCDKLGRPILFFIIRNFKPKNIDIPHFQRFCCYTINQAGASMNENVDQFIMIVDCSGFSYANWYVNHCKQMFWFISIINAGRQYTTILIKQNLIVKGILKIVNTFLDDGIRAKFRFLMGDYQEKLLQIIDAERLPKEYGGQAENVSGDE